MSLSINRPFPLAPESDTLADNSTEWVSRHTDCSDKVGEVEVFLSYTETFVALGPLEHIAVVGKEELVAVG